MDPIVEDQLETIIQVGDANYLKAFLSSNGISSRQIKVTNSFNPI